MLLKRNLTDLSSNRRQGCKYVLFTQITVGRAGATRTASSIFPSQTLISLLDLTIQAVLSLAEEVKEMANKKIELDSTDWKIIAELQRDARATFSEISKTVAMSLPAIRDRILRMEGSDIISGYHADINTNALGRTLHVMFTLKYNTELAGSKKMDDAINLFLKSTPEVIQFWSIYGELDFFIETAFNSKDRMNEFLNDLRKYGFVRSHMVEIYVKTPCSELVSNAK